MTQPRRLAGDAAMQELTDMIGEAAARALARHFGGTSIYVPRTVGDHHPICAAIGRDATNILAKWTGGSALAIPKQPEKRTRVLELHRGRALTVAQIARETAYSERHVYRLLREEEDARQPGLFD